MIISCRSCWNSVQLLAQSCVNTTRWPLVSCLFESCLMTNVIAYNHKLLLGVDVKVEKSKNSTCLSLKESWLLQSLLLYRLSHINHWHLFQGNWLFFSHRHQHDAPWFYILHLHLLTNGFKFYCISYSHPISHWIYQISIFLKRISRHYIVIELSSHWLFIAWVAHSSFSCLTWNAVARRESQRLLHIFLNENLLYYFYFSIEFTDGRREALLTIHLNMIRRRIGKQN